MPGSRLRMRAAPSNSWSMASKIDPLVAMRSSCGSRARKRRSLSHPSDAGARQRGQTVDSMRRRAYNERLPHTQCVVPRRREAKEVRMLKRLVVVTGVVLSLAWAGAHLIAQQTTAPRSAPAGQTKAATATAPDLSRMPLINVTMVQIKPELLTEWQDFQK